VVDADGTVVSAGGDLDQEVVPRSAVKALQALPLAGLGLDDRSLALACASHNAEPGHVAGVEAMLAAVGASVDDLACGAHWPYLQDRLVAMARSGDAPTAVHNNCSGKHAGFLSLAHHRGIGFAGYLDADGPVQTEVREAMEAVCGVRFAPPVVDGCSAPTWPLPLRALATGFARFGATDGGPARLRAAVAAQPWFVAGTGRFDTEVMAVTGLRAFVKVGAEGVYAGALPDRGLGVALKVDDGATRASEVAMAAVLAEHLPDVDLAAFTHRPVRSWRGQEVGEVRPAILPA
jgi:L-asparaginase II